MLAKFQEHAKEIAYIYCRNFLNYYYYCQSGF
jgi:hypothetical protein